MSFDREAAQSDPISDPQADITKRSNVCGEVYKYVFDYNTFIQKILYL